MPCGRVHFRNNKYSGVCNCFTSRSERKGSKRRGCSSTRKSNGSFCGCAGASGVSVWAASICSIPFGMSITSTSNSFPIFCVEVISAGSCAASLCLGAFPGRHVALGEFLACRVFPLSVVIKNLGAFTSCRSRAGSGFNRLPGHGPACFTASKLKPPGPSAPPDTRRTQCSRSPLKTGRSTIPAPARRNTP